MSRIAVRVAFRKDLVLAINQRRVRTAPAVPLHSELNLAIVTYETLVANYTRARAALLERRRSASDSVMIELDDRLAANQRTVDALRRAIEISHEHLKLLGCEPPTPLPGETSPGRSVDYQPG
jgi:hypothetical protein